MWGLLAVLIGIGIIIRILKTPYFKGKAGEKTGTFFFTRFLEQTEYHVLNDVILKRGDGTTQIDHIIVSPYGIFVVETKNMKGWIFGSQTDACWTQKIYGYTTRFQNPLRQNYKHVEAISSFLNLDKQKIHSVVLFLGDATFKTRIPENVFTGVGSCARYIKSKTEKIFSPDEVQTIIRKFNEVKAQTSTETVRSHIEHVQAIKARRNGIRKD